MCQTRFYTTIKHQNLNLSISIFKEKALKNYVLLLTWSVKAIKRNPLIAP